MRLLHTSSWILHKYNSITLQLSDGKTLGSTTIFISVSFGTKSGHVQFGITKISPPSYSQFTFTLKLTLHQHLAPQYGKCHTCIGTTHILSLAPAYSQLVSKPFSELTPAHSRTQNGWVHARICTHTHARTHAHMHTRTHTHTHTHTHTQDGEESESSS